MEITREDLLDIKIVIAENILELKKQEQYGTNVDSRMKHLKMLLNKMNCLMNDYELVKLGDD